MMNLFILAVCNALICVGLYRSFLFEYGPVSANLDGDFTREIDNDTKSIFWFWKFYVLDKLPYRLSKPLGNCLTCMASVYSFLPYWYCCNWNFTNFDYLITYPFYILIVAGLNGLADNYLNE